MPRPVRTVLYCLALLAAIVWLAARAAPPPVSSDETERDVTAAEMEQALAPLRAAVGRGERLVVVLGDSSLRWHPPLTKDETLTAMFERDGARAGVTLRVFAHDGFDPVAYYLLVDEIAALRPEAVVLVANFQAFTDDWFRRARMKHPQLAAFVRPARVPEAMRLPLELAGVADASLIVKPVLRAVGATDLPEKIDGYRTRVRERLDGVSATAAKTALAESGLANAAPPAATPAPPRQCRRRARGERDGVEAPGALSPAAERCSPRAPSVSRTSIRPTSMASRRPCASSRRRCATSWHATCGRSCCWRRSTYRR